MWQVSERVGLGRDWWEERVTTKDLDGYVGGLAGIV